MLASQANIAIKSGADPLVRGNRIHGGRDAGVVIGALGRGRILDNEISANLRAGVAIMADGDGIVSRNKIFDGLDSGVLLMGAGQLVDNDISANQAAAICIATGNPATVTRNRLRAGPSGVHFVVSKKASPGLVRDNVIEQVAGGDREAVQLPPDVQEHNTFRVVER